MLMKAFESHFSLLRLLSLLYIAWSALKLTLNTPVPLVVVTSESMMPAFRVGDVLLVSNYHKEVSVGDIAVCWLQGRQLPMVHRIIKRTPLSGLTPSSEHVAPGEGGYRYLTKGDNNDLDDVVLYQSGASDIGRGDIIGVVKGSLPYLGLPLLYIRGSIGGKLRMEDLSS